MKSLLYGIAYAQNLIPCADGTMADPALGCVAVPDAILNPESNLLHLILKIADYIATGAFSLAAGFLIYGGIRYATAAGNDDQVDNAKRILFWSVTGLVLSLAARLLVQFVLSIIR